MRHFVYFSASASTSGKALSDGDLMKAGRIDIAIHSFIQGVFLSHGIRDDVVFHFVFYGMPDPPKHIEIHINSELELSKKDIGTLLKKILYKYKEGEKREILPGCFVEKKSLLKVIEELSKQNEIFILDRGGENIRKIKFSENCVFVVGDHEGFPKKELKRMGDISTKISVGNKMYFASQTIAVVNNELDFQESRN